MINVDKILEQEVFWSPSVCWRKENDSIIIENNVYGNIALELFPKLYFLTQRGITVGKLIEEFPSLDQRKLKRFIGTLIGNRSLVSGLMKPEELFFSQKFMFDNDFSDEIMFNPEEYEKYKKTQMNRHADMQQGDIVLSKAKEIPSFITERKSVREFSKEKITFEQLCTILGCFKQNKQEDKCQYYYPSAGGLYPVDVYLYIKEDRVEDVAGGLYLYNTEQNALHLVNNESITSDIHYSTNGDIFNESAITMFMIYNGKVNMPKYGGMGYFYGNIDCGIMMGTLNQLVEMNGLGMCCIGTLNFEKIREQFHLNRSQVFLQAIEVGKKK